MKILSDLTLNAIKAESARAYAKHGECALLGDGLTTLGRLTALVEEVGEVGKALTYDNDSGKLDLIKELIQVANVAASWAEWLDTHDGDIGRDSALFPASQG